MKDRPLRRAVLRKIVFAIPLTREWYRRGYFNRAVRKQRFVNYFFKRVFGVNADVPWSVHFTSRVVVPTRIKFGEGVERSFMFSGGCYIQGGNGIEIGDGTIFAPGVKIISANHDPQDLSQWKPDRPIKIGKNCWIGANAVILPGVELGDNVIVGAGAVVTKSFPGNVIVAGNPARIIRELPGKADGNWQGKQGKNNEDLGKKQKCWHEPRDDCANLARFESSNSRSKECWWFR